MEMIRQYAIVHDGVVQITVPEEFNEQPVEVQIILMKPDEFLKNTSPESDFTLGALIGKYKHFTPEQNAKIDHELNELRDSWERNIF